MSQGGIAPRRTHRPMTRQLRPSRPSPRPRHAAAVSVTDRDEVVARIAPLLRQALTEPAPPVNAAVVRAS